MWSFHVLLFFTVSWVAAFDSASSADEFANANHRCSSEQGPRGERQEGGAVLLQVSSGSASLKARLGAKSAHSETAAAAAVAEDKLAQYTVLKQTLAQSQESADIMRKIDEALDGSQQSPISSSDSGIVSASDAQSLDDVIKIQHAAANDPQVHRAAAVNGRHRAIPAISLSQISATQRKPHHSTPEKGEVASSVASDASEVEDSDSSPEDGENSAENVAAPPGDDPKDDTDEEDTVNPSAPPPEHSRHSSMLAVPTQGDDPKDDTDEEDTVNPSAPPAEHSSDSSAADAEEAADVTAGSGDDDNAGDDDDEDAQNAGDDDEGAEASSSNSAAGNSTAIGSKASDSKAKTSNDSEDEEEDESGSDETEEAAANNDEEAEDEDLEALAVKEDEADKKRREKLSLIAIMDMIEASKAPLNENGYLNVATSRSNSGMERFVERLASEMSLQIVDVGGLKGMVPFYSGQKSTQSFEALQAELRSAARMDDGWVVKKARRHENLLLQTEASQHKATTHHHKHNAGPVALLSVVRAVHKVPDIAVSLFGSRTLVIVFSMVCVACLFCLDEKKRTSKGTEYEDPLNMSPTPPPVHEDPAVAANLKALRGVKD